MENRLQHVSRFSILLLEKDCQDRAVLCYLEVEDASVVITEALVTGNHSGHHVLIESQRGDGGQQPAVT